MFSQPFEYLHYYPSSSSSTSSIFDYSFMDPSNPTGQYDAYSYPEIHPASNSGQSTSTQSSPSWVYPNSAPPHPVNFQTQPHWLRSQEDPQGGQSSRSFTMPNVNHAQQNPPQPLSKRKGKRPFDPVKPLPRSKFLKESGSFSSGDSSNFGQISNTDLCHHKHQLCCKCKLYMPVTNYDPLQKIKEIDPNKPSYDGKPRGRQRNPVADDPKKLRNREYGQHYRKSVKFENEKNMIKLIWMEKCLDAINEWAEKTSNYQVCEFWKQQKAKWSEVDQITNIPTSGTMPD